MEKLARFGYVAKGVVYLLIGILAVLAAFSVGGGKTTGTSGALRTVAAQPFGTVLLLLIGIGLFGYVIWRLIQAIKDPEHKGNDAQGIARRLGFAVSGLAYAGLAVNAILLAVGTGGGGGGNSKQDWTARLLQQPLGQWLVGVVGALFIGMGIYRIYQAYKTKFRKKLNLAELDAQKQDLLVQVSRFGVAARGVIFIILGFFFIQAARQSDASEVKGLDGVLLTVAQQPFGKILLVIVALGLVAYGIYLFVQAKYRRININN
ncbi:DUF1206 domain-containing protein [Myxosarcina sp. GI1(2024)]